MAKKRGLGRGLDALLGNAAVADAEIAGAQVHTLPIEDIEPGRYQPRSHIDAERLRELADSIRAQGVIQPIVVREVRPGRYEIIAGERRWRAAQLASLREVPVVVRSADDNTALALALIENIQREDLNPLEESHALKRLIDEFGLTHQQAADAVGRSRAAVSNLLRLLECPAPIRELVRDGALEMGHARALLALPEAKAVALARQAAAGGWSVREVERRVQRLAAAAGKPGRRKSGSGARDADVLALERELSEQLNARVSVEAARGGRGRLVVHYHSLDELEGILERLRRPQ
ncbi:MAG TPA: ParB/RepB/Spo0J family partition protein [Xanthomonadaceae bacterium]|nr:ParB/RepB/Spo0J family partition protein [Xanthomonadaceae bacterium]